MTADWGPKPIGVPYADFGDPQTLNLYSIVRENPETSADLDGHQGGCGFDGGGSCGHDSNSVCGGDSASGDGCHAPNKNQNPNTAQNTNAHMQELKGAGKVLLGAGLIATAAFGDAPGGVAGALLVASAGLGGASTSVSGVADIAGAATNTDVSKAQEALEATGNLGGLVVTAGSGGNLKAGQTAATLTDVATLAANPKDAARNVFTAVDAVRTTVGAIQTARQAQQSSTFQTFVGIIKSFFSTSNSNPGI